MSRDFWFAVTLIVASFAIYETGINFYLRRLHTEAVGACVRISAPEAYTQARAE